jgi:hypothetical protein
MTDQLTDAQHCPLCGKNNQCAMTTGEDPASCWCITTNINPDSLAKIPESQRNKSCLCLQCAQRVEEQAYEG